MPRNPDWDLPAMKGTLAELTVRALRCAALVGACEVKRDDRAIETGNIFVETMYRSAAGRTASGPATRRADNHCYVIGHGRIVVWMPTWVLVEVVERGSSERECNWSDNPSRGRIVALKDLLPMALAIVREVGRDER